MDQELQRVLIVHFNVEVVQLPVLAHVILDIVTNSGDQQTLSQLHVDHALRLVRHVKRLELIIVTRVQLEKV